MVIVALLPLPDHINPISPHFICKYVESLTPMNPRVGFSKTAERNIVKCSVTAMAMGEEMFEDVHLDEGRIPSHAGPVKVNAGSTSLESKLLHSPSGRAWCHFARLINDGHLNNCPITTDPPQFRSDSGSSVCKPDLFVTTNQSDGISEASGVTCGTTYDHAVYRIETL